MISKNRGKTGRNQNLAIDYYHIVRSRIGNIHTTNAMIMILAAFGLFMAVMLIVNVMILNNVKQKYDKIYVYHNDIDAIIKENTSNIKDMNMKLIKIGESPSDFESSLRGYKAIISKELSSIEKKIKENHTVLNNYKKLILKIKNIETNLLDFYKSLVPLYLTFGKTSQLVTITEGKGRKPVGYMIPKAVTTYVKSGNIP